MKTSSDSLLVLLCFGGSGRGGGGGGGGKGVTGMKHENNEQNFLITNIFTVISL